MANRALGKLGWHRGGGGGIGTITNGNNLGAGAEVFEGLSGIHSNIMDFRTLTGSAGISATQSATEVNISGAGVIGDNLMVVQSFNEGSGVSTAQALVNECYFAACIPWNNATVNAIQIHVESLGATPTAYDIAMYNNAGTLIASKTTAQTPSATGLFLINFDSPANVLANEKVWVAIAGSSGTTTTLLADNNSANSTSWNRFITAQPTVPAGNLPAGTATFRRFWFRLMNYALISPYIISLDGVPLGD